LFNGGDDYLKVLADGVIRKNIYTHWKGENDKFLLKECAMLGLENKEYSTK
jgi:hypothetical protein